jgi:hypothetical protein
MTNEALRQTIAETYIANDPVALSGVLTSRMARRRRVQCRQDRAGALEAAGFVIFRPTPDRRSLRIRGTAQ